MARKYIVGSLLLCALSPNVAGQFYDFFQGFQPLLQSYTTERIGPSRSSNYGYNFEPNRRRTETRTQKNPFSFFFDSPERTGIKKTTKHHSNKQTTAKPFKSVESSHETSKYSNNNNDNTRNKNVNNEYNSYWGLEEHHKNKRRPVQGGTNSNNIIPENFYETSNKVTTKAPTYNTYLNNNNYNSDNDNRGTQQNNEYDYPRPNYDNDRQNSNRPSYDSSYSTREPEYGRPEYNNARPDYVRPDDNNRRPDFNVYTTKRPEYVRPDNNNDRPEYVRPDNNNRRPDYNIYTTKRPNYVRPENNNDRPDNSNERPDYNTYTTKRPDYNYNSHTTQSPFYNRPGVKPLYTQGPPITNRPVSPSSIGSYNGDPTDAVFFPDDEPPELIRGPNEDEMSTAQKRRYIDIAERMCDHYKSLDVSQVAAIPLVPSPEPVKVNISDCPISLPLIVGGKEVDITQSPHNAALGWPNVQGGGYSWKCGGTLISDQFVLTAAHCANQERDLSVATGPPRAVQLGSSHLNDPGALVVKVAKSIRHPKYTLSKSYNDIAVLKLVSKVRFSEVIKPACLGSPPYPGQSIVATGWGRTRFGGDASKILRGVAIPVWDIEECARVFGTSKKMPYGPVAENQMCAGSDGKDTCQGDSGGPAAIQDECAWRVVGVTSVGRACGAPHTPAVYAVVKIPFIIATITTL